MEVELKALLNSINSRFSGPESCRMQDMINGKLDFDDEEIKNYLNRLITYGGINLNYQTQTDRTEAQRYLTLFTDFIDEKNKRQRSRN